MTSDNPATSKVLIYITATVNSAVSAYYWRAQDSQCLENLIFKIIQSVKPPIMNAFR